MIKNALERLGRALHGKWFLGQPLWNRRGFEFACRDFSGLFALGLILWVLVLIASGAHIAVSPAGNNLLYNRWGGVAYVSMGGFCLILLLFLTAAILWITLVLDRWYVKKFSKTGRIAWEKIREDYHELIVMRYIKK